MKPVVALSGLSLMMTVGLSVCPAEPPPCTGEVQSYVLEMCSDPGELCEGTTDCAVEDSCEGYWTLFPPAWMEPDVRKVRMNPVPRPRNCLAHDPEVPKTTLCVWEIEDCYERRTCYLDTDADPDRCVRGQQCGGTFTADWTHTSENCRRNEVGS